MPVRVEMDGMAAFHWNGRRVAMACMTGPERIETAWWQARDVRRDYYVAEAETGARYWLFQRLDGGGWFLHGTFE